MLGALVVVLCLNVLVRGKLLHDKDGKNKSMYRNKYI